MNKATREAPPSTGNRLQLEKAIERLSETREINISSIISAVSIVLEEYHEQNLTDKEAKVYLEGFKLMGSLLNAAYREKELEDIVQQLTLRLQQKAAD